MKPIIPENHARPESAGRVSPCPRCDQLVADLDAARQAVTYVTAASIDAMMWGARHLDDPHTDRHDAAETVAEGLLDRFGRILSALTGQTIDHQNHRDLELLQVDRDKLRDLLRRSAATRTQNHETAREAAARKVWLDLRAVSPTVTTPRIDPQGGDR